MTLSYRQKIIITSLVLYWPALFVLSHIPIPQLVREAGVSDKSLHFLAYLILVFFIWFAISPDKKVNWRKAVPWWILLVVVLYGIIDEISQSYVGRSCDILDFFTNLVGALTGLVLFTIFTFWPAAVLVAGIVIFGTTNIARANLADTLPITNAMFHLLAYTIFTMLWIQCLRTLKPVKTSHVKRLIPALGGPIAFLLIVKMFSVILGRVFVMYDIIVSIGAIAGTFCLLLLYHKNTKTGFK
jgi:VanZ family protein